MKIRDTRPVLAAMVTAACLCLWAPAPASAQFSSDGAIEPVSPPRPGKADDSAPVMMTYLLGILLLGAAVGANLLAPKRGHQD